MAQSSSQGSLGTFAGVFTPSILTILGIILFLRLGYVVGAGGLFHALVIIAAANLISVLTSFSLAAVATNMKIRGGGDYYLISRTLGLEFGGAIGLVLFLAQSVSIAFYCMGFGESVYTIFGGTGSGVPVQIIAGIALVFLFALAWKGADLATKFQYGVMAFLVLALVSFYLGGIRHFDSSQLTSNWTRPVSGPGFWVLFALFFPAVTGFTQGVSMSGDLKDPGKSLPIGTFGAVALSIVVYFSVALIFAGTSPLSVLSNDYGVMKRTALWGPLIDAGVIAATLSSAMASFLGAPRILQSLSSDRIFPFLGFFAKGEGPGDNPRRGVVLSFAIAAVTVVLGELDLIAGVVSMFFLISYGLLNYATYFEASAESPSFRPRFHWYHRNVSLAGAAICLGVMLAIDLEKGLVATAVLFGIYQYLRRTAGPARWADSSRSVHLKAVRDNLVAAQKTPAHPREWRPVILALAEEGSPTEGQIRFSSLIAGNSGMTTAVCLIHGRGVRGMRLKEAAVKEMSDMIRDAGLNAFPLALTAEELRPALAVLLQSQGLGPVRPNTVVLDMADLTDENGLFPSQLRTILRNQCNLVLLASTPPGPASPVPGADRAPQIHVWWQDDDTSRLMLLLAYLLTRNPAWENAALRLMAFHLDADTEEHRGALNQMLEEIRIEAEAVIVPVPSADEMVRISSSADFVFLPVILKDNILFVREDLHARDLFPRLNTTALVLAAEKVDLSAEPDAGPQGELAELLDRITRAENRVDRAQKAYRDAAKAAGDLMDSLESPDLSDPRILEGLKVALAARDKADAAEKKTLKEKAKLALLSQDARDKGIVLDKDIDDDVS